MVTSRMPVSVVSIARAARKSDGKTAERLVHYEAIVAELNFRLAELEAQVAQVRFHRDAWAVCAASYQEVLETQRRLSTFEAEEANRRAEREAICAPAAN